MRQGLLDNSIFQYPPITSYISMVALEILEVSPNMVSRLACEYGYIKVKTKFKRII